MKRLRKQDGAKGISDIAPRSGAVFVGLDGITAALLTLTGFKTLLGFALGRTIRVLSHYKRGSATRFFPYPGIYFQLLIVWFEYYGIKENIFLLFAKLFKK